MIPRNGGESMKEVKEAKKKNETEHITSEKTVLSIICFGSGVSNAALQYPCLCWTHRRL